MLAGVVLAACLSAPYYPREWGGPLCTTEKQALECECSECMTWDVTSGSEWYELLRENPGGTSQWVGSTRSRNHAAVPATVYDGIPIPAIPAEIVRSWCPAWDQQFPAAGELYSYRVRGCRAARPGEIADVCGSWSLAAVAYRATRYGCYAGGREVNCRTGVVVVRP